MTAATLQTKTFTLVNSVGMSSEFDIGGRKFSVAVAERKDVYSLGERLTFTDCGVVVEKWPCCSWRCTCKAGPNQHCKVYNNGDPCVEVLQLTRGGPCWTISGNTLAVRWTLKQGLSSEDVVRTQLNYLKTEVVVTANGQSMKFAADTEEDIDGVKIRLVAQTFGNVLPPKIVYGYRGQLYWQTSAPTNSFFSPLFCQLQPSTGLLDASADYLVSHYRSTMNVPTRVKNSKYFEAGSQYYSPVQNILPSGCTMKNLATRSSVNTIELEGCNGGLLSFEVSVDVSAGDSFSAASVVATVTKAKSYNTTCLEADGYFLARVGITGTKGSVQLNNDRCVPGTIYLKGFGEEFFTIRCSLVIGDKNEMVLNFNAMAVVVPYECVSFKDRVGVEGGQGTIDKGIERVSWLDDVTLDLAGSWQSTLYAIIVFGVIIAIIVTAVCLCKKKKGRNYKGPEINPIEFFKKLKSDKKSKKKMKSEREEI